MARTRQPQRVTRISWGDSRASGLIAAYNFAGGLHNLVDGVSLVPTTTTRKITSGGVGYSAAAGARSGLAAPYTSAHLPTAATILFVQEGTTATQGWHTLSGADTSGDAYPYGASIYTAAFWGTRWANGVANKVPYTSLHSVAMQVRDGSQRLSQNGITVTTNTLTGAYSPPSGVGNFYMKFGGSVDASIYYHQGNTLAVLLWNRYLADAEVNSLSINPWQLFAPSRRIWVQLGAAAGGGAVTGTASITQSPQTLTGAGTVAIAGTLNKTPAAQTATTAAAVAIAGTLIKTQAAQTVTTAGSVAVSGTFNKAPAAQTLTASGTVASGVTGTANITPAAQTVTAAGTVAIAASATITPSAQTATASGAVQVAATATVTPAAQTVTATGTVVSRVVGNAWITPAAQTATASGTVAIAATATVTPAAQTVSATGTVVSRVVGNAWITPAAQTATASGTVAIAATATVTPAAQTVSATGTVSGGAVTGTANVFVSAQTLVAAANIIVLGTATITPAAHTLLGLEAGTLPAEIPESSRTLAQMTGRLGSEWVDTDPARLGLATARRSRPRLG